MNKTYRTIFSPTRGVTVVVNEATKLHTKSGKRAKTLISSAVRLVTGAFMVGILTLGGPAAAQATNLVLQGNQPTNAQVSDLNIGDKLIGGWEVENSGTLGQVQKGSTLSFTAGKLNAEEVIAGSYLKVNNNTHYGSDSLELNHGDISTTLSGSTVDEYAIGGSKIATYTDAKSNVKTATVVTGTTTLTITGGRYGGDYGNPEVAGSTKGKYGGLVIGGNYVKTTGSQSLANVGITDSTNVVIENGTFEGSVVGGSVAHSYQTVGDDNRISVTDGSTNISISGGTFNASAGTDSDNGFQLHASVIGGGLAKGANTQSTIVDGSNVSITGGTYNSKVVAGSYVTTGGKASNGSTSLKIDSTNITFEDDLIGGGLIDTGSGTSNTPDLTVTGASSVTVNFSAATADKNYVDGEIYGGSYVRVSGYASGTDSSVTINDIFQKAATNKAQYIAGGSKSMASGGTTSEATLSGTSSVTVNGGTIEGGSVVGGSVAKAGNDNSTASATVGSSSAIVTGGTLVGVVGGGLAETYFMTSGSGSATSQVTDKSSVSVSGGTVNNIKFGASSENFGELSASVVGGGLANTDYATAFVGETSVNITGGTINGKVVAGGAAVNGGTTTVNGDSKLIMTGGTVTGDLIGGNLIDGSSNRTTAYKDSSIVKDNTWITMTGGLVDGEIIGGSVVRNATADSTVEGNTHVTVAATAGNNEPQQHVQYVLGGGKASAFKDQVAESNVLGSTYVTVEGNANIGYGTVAGGGLARGQAGQTTATVGKNTNVAVSGGTLAGVVGGGIAETYDAPYAKAEANVNGSSNLTISGDTTVVNSVIYLGTKDSEIAVVGAGVSYSSWGNATSTVGTANTTINGSIIKGHVVAGGLADTTDGKTEMTASDLSANSTTTTAKLTINGGSIEGSVYTGGAILGEKSTVTTTTSTVDINGGTITGNLVLGDYTLKSSDTADAAMSSGSTVTVTMSNAAVTGTVKVLTDDSSVTFDSGISTVGGYSQTSDSTTTVNDGATMYLKTGTLGIGSGTVRFDSGSTLTVDASAVSSENGYAIKVTGGNLTVNETSTLVINDASAGATYYIADGTNALWSNVRTSSDMITLTMTTSDNKGTITATAADASAVYTDMGSDMANVVNALYDQNLNDVESKARGVRLLSRATDNRYLGADKAKAVSTIENAARFAVIGAVPQMTKMASDIGTNSVVNRLGFASVENAPAAVNTAGEAVSGNAQGVALWVTPLWQKRSASDMDAGNIDYGFDASIGGIAVGADYTFANSIRAGFTFNAGSGNADSSGSLTGVENSMDFWGVGAYAGWSSGNFGLIADVTYTDTSNDVTGSLDSRLGMGSSLTSDIDASAVSAGVRAEYKVETSVVDLVAHAGVRYMRLHTKGYDVNVAGGTVLTSDSSNQNIWTFPIGITLSKEIEAEHNWHFKPVLDFTVIPAAGDVDSQADVRFTGMPVSSGFETQMMDRFTWQGGAGVEIGTDNMTFGVNYTLQSSRNYTGHGLFGSFRYVF